MAQQTAVEWLDEQLQDKMYVQYGYGTGIRKIVIPIDEYIYFKKQAKSMEKEQIKTAYNDGADHMVESKYEGMDNYYNLRYGSNNKI